MLAEKRRELSEAYALLDEALDELRGGTYVEKQEAERIAGRARAAQRRAASAGPETGDYAEVGAGEAQAGGAAGERGPERGASGGDQETGGAGR